MLHNHTQTRRISDDVIILARFVRFALDAARARCSSGFTSVDDLRRYCRVEREVAVRADEQTERGTEKEEEEEEREGERQRPTGTARDVAIKIFMDRRDPRSRRWASVLRIWTYRAEPYAARAVMKVTRSCPEMGIVSRDRAIPRAENFDEIYKRSRFDARGMSILAIARFIRAYSARTAAETRGSPLYLFVVGIYDASTGLDGKFYEIFRDIVNDTSLNQRALLARIVLR